MKGGLRLSLVILLMVVMVGPSTMAATKKKKRLHLKKIIESTRLSAEDLDTFRSDSEIAKRVSSEKKFEVASIEYEGVNSEMEAQISAETLIHPGDEVTDFHLISAAKNLRSLGLFSDVTVHTKKTKSKAKVVVFSVTPFPVIHSIRFDGATLIAQEALVASLNSKQGERLSLEKVKRDIDVINRLYTEKGYMDSRVIGIETPDKPEDPLIFKISEKKIEEIRVTGNRTTKSYVILRELTSKIGSPLHGPTIKEDYKRIYNLNYFSEVRPNFLPGKDPSSVIMEWNVDERKSNGSFTFGGGYGPTSGLSMFSNLYWDNLFGMGQLIMLNAQIGNISNTYQFKYYNPWMWDVRKSFTFKAWYRDGSTESVNPLGNSGLTFLGERSTGVEVGVGLPITYEFKTSHSIKHENVTLTSANRTYRVQSYTFGLSLDTRDIWFNPTQGEYHTFSLERAYPFSSEAINFTRYNLDLRKFIKTFDQQTVALRLSLGLIESPQLGDSQLFQREYYRVGGATTVRGYNEFEPFAIGSRQVVVSAEYRWLFNDAFSIILFVDAGYAPNFRDPITGNYSNGVPINEFNRYRVGKGIGTRFNMPVLGPLRLDFGIDDQGNSRIHFNVGNTF